MRTILTAVLLLGILPAGLASEPPDAPEPDEPSSSPVQPGAFPGADPDPEKVAFQAPDAPAPPNPNAITVRRPTVLHWWEDPIFDRRITLKLENTDLNMAIDALGRAANMNLIAAGGSKARKKVTLNLRNAPLRDVMLALANLYELIWFKSGEVFTLTYVSASTRRAGPSAPAPTRVRRPILVVPTPQPAPRR